MNTPTIFISIAAYREFDLVNTVQDAINNADSPDRLRFCICWQHAPDDSLEGLELDPRVHIIGIPFQESQGVCWARHLIQQHYDGETYSLQIDGHHRFAPQWDQRMIDMLEFLKQNGVKKPILTGYVPGFDPDNDPAGRDGNLWFTGLDRFEPSGVVFMKPYTPTVKPEKPIPCRFWSAHFSFSDGCFNQEVEIDPNGYFHAEEISTGVRAWTHGYDFFLPNETLIWHEYSRKGRICHWNDHSDWGQRNAKAISRYRAQFGLDGITPLDFPPYGFGSQRSLREYERFAGICFDCRGVEQHTIEHGIPPGPLFSTSEAQWRENLKISHCIDLNIDRTHFSNADELLFFAVFANKADGTELYREDYLKERIEYLLSTQRGPQLYLFISFFSAQRPDAWTLWPHSKDHHWLDKIDGNWPKPSGPDYSRDL